MKLKAIILSAGEGSRMRPLTLTKPKTMLPVAGKPIIQYNIESLREKHSEMGYEVTDLKGLPGEKPHYYFVTDPDGYKVEVIRTEC